MILLAIRRLRDDFQVGLEPAGGAAGPQPAAPAVRLGAQQDQSSAGLLESLLDDQPRFGNGECVIQEGDGWLALT